MVMDACACRTLRRLYAGSAWVRAQPYLAVTSAAGTFPDSTDSPGCRLPACLPQHNTGIDCGYPSRGLPTYSLRFAVLGSSPARATYGPRLARIRYGSRVIPGLAAYRRFVPNTDGPDITS